MDWKINLLIVISIVTLVASVIASLEKIARFTKGLVRPVCKRIYIRKGTWPLKMILKSGRLNYNGSVTVNLLVEPRKSVILGKCESVYPDGFKTSPNYPLESADFQEWPTGALLDNPRTYILNFYAPKTDNVIQIQIEVEGYQCKSNPLKIDMATVLGEDNA